MDVLTLLRTAPLAALGSIALITFPLPAQEAAPKEAKLSFEVASIRPNTLSTKGGEGSRRESIEPGPANLTMRNVSLESCIRWAYNVPQRQISGPGWLNLERFDIVAKSSSPASEMQLRLMLQTLLADRFKLALHRESKEMSVFVLLVGKGGHKLSESQGDGPPKMQPNKMLMVCERVTMPQLCELLSDPMQAPVLDLTELKGRYDFSLDPSKYLPADLSPGDGGKSPGDGAKMRLAEELPTMFRSMLQDQLGLRMESRKAPVEILIIDAAEKAPTEN